MKPGNALWMIILAPLALAQTDPGGVLDRLTVTRFTGSGFDAIQAMTSDRDGNIYVAGTTSSVDFPVRNAAQPSSGEAIVLRTSDRGITWQKLPHPPDLPLAVTPDPVDSQTLLIASRSGIYKTSDSGQSWHRVYGGPIGPNPPTDCCVNLAIDPANQRRQFAFLRTLLPALFLASSDGGESWVQRALPAKGAAIGSPRELWVDPNGSGIVGIGLARSADMGSTWMTMNSPVADGIVDFTVPVPGHPGWIYASTHEQTGGSLFLSQDWGATWTMRPSPLQPVNLPSPLAALLFDPDLPSAIYAVTLSGFLYVSQDAGGSWQPASKLGTRPVALRRSCSGGGLFGIDGGVTASLDFGATVKPPQFTRMLDLATGPGCTVYAGRGMASDAFVARLKPNGEVVWSTLLGGSDQETAAAIRVDEQGNVYVAGRTFSPDFPVTSGGPGGPGAFLAKYGPNGGILYSTVTGSGVPTALAINGQGEAFIAGVGFLTKAGADGSPGFTVGLPVVDPVGGGSPLLTPPMVNAVAAEAGGSALAGVGGLLFRVSADGSTVTPLEGQAGSIFAMETDASGDVYLAGQVTTGPLGSGRCLGPPDGLAYSMVNPGDVFVTKLRASSLEQVFSTRLSGSCRSWPSYLQVTSQGEPTVGLWTLGAFPMRNAALPVAANCDQGVAVVSRLSADGSTILYSSFLDVCGTAAPFAIGADSTIYPGVSRQHAAVLRLPAPPLQGPMIERVANAFSGAPGVASAGMLVAITGQNLAPSFADLGLDDANPLPTQLGGVQVVFDGVAAGLMQVAPDHILAVVPPLTPGADAVGVQVTSGGQDAAPFILPATRFGNVGLLTVAFPNLPPAGSNDGFIFNADGTRNDAGHQASVGSTVTLFATGLTAPGPISLLWNQPPPVPSEVLNSYPAVAYPMRGFISAIYAVRFQIPPGSAINRAEIGRVGSGVGVYVQ